ncbi:MAG: LysR family transcriptional regulator [Akkermansiaceae bacterium]|nr:LysR family transcriptional regulator [Armatimonadota bacterium]
MEMHQLEAFAAVARERSFTRASHFLHLTQPAVTRAVAALESELKTRLFDRLGRTVQLTPSGETLLRYAERVLQLTREAKAAVTDIETGSAGRLAVGASSTLATYLLPPLLAQFRQAHPAVEIGIHTGISAHIRTRVRSGAADVGLVTTGPHDEATVGDGAMTMVPLAGLDTCVVMPPSHPMAASGCVSAATLLSGGLPLLLMETGTNLREYAEAVFGSAVVPAMELDNVEAIKRMIAAGLGFSLLPELAVRTEVIAGTLATLKLSGVSHTSGRRIELVYRRDKYLTAALRRFIALLQAEVPKL